MLEIIDSEKRKLLAGKLADLANYIAVALVIGQLLNIEKLNETLLVWGVVMSICFYWASFAIHPSKKQ